MDSFVAWFILLIWILRLLLFQAQAKVQIPHAHAPFELAMGGLEERLRKSKAEPEKADMVHFRQLGTISGDVGMVHIGIAANIRQYEEIMDKVCDMPNALRDDINKLIWHDKPTSKMSGKRFVDNSTISQKPPRNGVSSSAEKPKSGKYYDRVLSNLNDECDMLKNEIHDMFLIWYSSFNRAGTKADDDSVVGIQVRSSDYELNEGNDDANDEDGDEDNFIPGIPPEYRVDREIDTGKDRGTGTGVPSDTERENWRYWLIRKLQGNWPPTYKEMPQYSDGRVKIDLWNYINKKINRYYDRKGLNGTSEGSSGSVNGLDVKFIETKRKKRKAKSDSELSRHKRFFPGFFTLLGMAAAAISSLIFTEYEVNRLAETAEHNLDSSIKVMEKHENRLNIDETTIKNLNKSIKLVMDKVTTISHRLRADELVQEVNTISQFIKQLKQVHFR